jgi:hypothetical protein
MKIFLPTYFLFFLSNCLSTSSPQSDTTLEGNHFEKLSRLRLSVGYVDLFGDEDDFADPFFNLSFRSSGFDRSSSKFMVKLAFEVGINALIISHEYVDNVDLYFLPYAKFGPDIRLYNNLFIAGSAGLAFATYEGNFAPVPFLGLNGFYLIELNEKFSLELESGIHTTLGWPLLFYVTVGISLI